MCLECGCSIGHNHNNEKLEIVEANPQLNDTKTINVIKKILDKNDHEAEHNRVHFDKNNVLAINLMSSPGAGKTTLLEKLAKLDLFKFAVIEGDLETNYDAKRLQEVGVEAYQIATGTACHLDAFMVHKGLHHIDLSKIDVCFIENVGNLVCPASYDVGAHLNIVLVSIPEGEGKIAKYPVMFRQADLVLFTKTDLLPYFNYDIKKEKEVLKKLKPNVDIIEFNINNQESIQKVAQWIKYKIDFRV